MSLNRQKLPTQNKGKRNQKTIPKSTHPGPDFVQEAGEAQEKYDMAVQVPVFEGLNPVFQESQAAEVPEKTQKERDMDVRVPVFEGLNPVSQVSQTAGAPEESAAVEPGIPDAVREEVPEESAAVEPEIPYAVKVKNEDSFFKKLGRVIYAAGSQKIKEPMPVEVIYALYRGIYAGLSEKEKQGISPLLEEQVVTALSRIPSYLLAEKDPDHPGENNIPDISELLALDAYLQKYEQINPEGMPSETYSGYHRGASGQPDFVYQNERRETLKSYDPLKLPREDRQEEWLSGAFEDHSGGKNTGAVCILDVSDASDEKLAFWIDKFEDALDTITDAIDADKDKPIQNDRLIHLCNTYVVSYGENANKESVTALQDIFERARGYLRTKSDLTQLDDWRAESSKPVDLSDAFSIFFGE